MALEISHKDQGTSSGVYVAEERLWETADGELVPDGHPDAAVLFATPGYEIPLDVAIARGLAEAPEPAAGQDVEAAVDVEPAVDVEAAVDVEPAVDVEAAVDEASEPKRAARPRDKQRKPASDK